MRRSSCFIHLLYRCCISLSAHRFSSFQLLSLIFLYLHCITLSHTYISSLFQDDTVRVSCLQIICTTLAKTQHDDLPSYNVKLKTSITKQFSPPRNTIWAEKSEILLAIAKKANILISNCFLSQWYQWFNLGLGKILMLYWYSDMKLDMFNIDRFCISLCWYDINVFSWF